jgi:hypothetical protein
MAQPPSWAEQRSQKSLPVQRAEKMPQIIQGAG